MKERPIIFSGPMVRAILEGRKTQTRRMLRHSPQPPRAIYSESHCRPVQIQECPYGVPGDRLWVKETWAHVPITAYRSSEGVQQTSNPTDPDMAAVYAAGWERSQPGRWRLSIHMPRWASRITLEIEAVRVERLIEITAEDCIAEGIANRESWTMDGPSGLPWLQPHGAFRELWESIHGPGSWDANPWVWVIQFRKI